MQAFLKRVGERILSVFHGVKKSVCADRTKTWMYRVMLGVASLGAVWGGWLGMQIASGLREGVAFNFLPATLPLLFSGTIYIDRFSAVFVVILAALTLLTWLRGVKGVLCDGLAGAVLVLGIISAASPFTLVAWIVATTVFYARTLAQKNRVGFVMSMVALTLAVLLLSGGAFLADMTVVATISSQLPANIVLLALALLFGGALWSIQSLKGVYVLVPAYVALRLCLFFLGGVSAFFLSIVALVALFCALALARKGGERTGAQIYAYLLFVSIPLTMIAVQMQVITAVQCFLFGGLALACAGLLGDAVKPVTRFAQSIFPGTFLSMGALLFFAGLFSLGEVVGNLSEQVYLIVIGVGVILVFIFAMRSLAVQDLASWREVHIDAWAQKVLLVSGGIFFAHILAYLGTTLGGETPDQTLVLPFAAQTLSVVPWILFVVSAVVAIACGAIKKYRPEYWNRAAHLSDDVYAWLRMRTALSQVWMSEGVVRRSGEKIHSWIGAYELRAEKSTMQEKGIYILALLVVTLIILF